MDAYLQSFFNVRRSLLTIGLITTALLILLAGLFWDRATVQRSDAEGILQTTAMEDLLLVAAQEWSVERGLTHAALKGADAISEPALAGIKEHRQAGDEAFAQALEALRAAARDDSGLNRFSRDEAYFKSYAATRIQVDKELGRALANRGEMTAEDSFDRITDLITMSARLRIDSRHRTKTVQSDISALQDLKHAVWVMGEFADREWAIIAGTISANDPIVLSDVERLSAFRGRLEQAWANVETYERVSTPVPEVTAAIMRVRREFFTTFEQLRAPIILAGMEGSDYPVTVDEWIVSSEVAITPIRELGVAAGTVSRALAEDVNRTGRNNLIILNVVLAITVLLALFLYKVIGRITNPLRDISRAMTSIVSEGEEAIEIPSTDRPDEIGDMARAVQIYRDAAEKHAREIFEANDSLKNMNEALEDRVQERTAQLENSRKEMESARDEAIAANEAKSEFLSRMSHELRTPLNAIIGFSSLLEEDEEDPLNELQAESVHEITKGGEHLLALINEVLDLAAIESGRMSLSVEPVKVTELVRECLSLSQPIAEKRGIELIDRCEEGGGGPVLMADRMRLSQVLLNLLSNAIKYNVEGGRVFVETGRAEDGAVTLSIRDTGRGISKKNHDLIYEPFNRLGVEDGSVLGSGIGLTIARNLVEVMHGKMGFESEEGEGATFWVSFPEADGATRESTVSDPEAVDEKKVEITHTVLYVEDNPANLRLMEKIMGRVKQVTMISAHNGELGLEMANQHLPDLIILDINLPGMDGFDILKVLLNTDQTKDIPVIALSANAMPVQVQKGMDAGFKRYLTKPIKANQVLEAVGEMLGLEL